MSRPVVEGDSKTMSAYKEELFLESWIEGVKIAGPELFGDGLDPDIATSKWDLRPRIAEIEHRISEMSCGEALFVASMVCFYNDGDGSTLLRSLVQGSDFGIGFIAASLDEDRRRIIADLFANYPGW